MEAFVETHIDDPETSKGDIKDFVKYPKRIMADNDLHVKIRKNVKLPKRENELMDQGFGIETEVDILKEFGIKEENDKKEESKTHMVSNEDSEPVQIVIIDPDSFNGICVKSETQ